jgi:hypothetical protein
LVVRKHDRPSSWKINICFRVFAYSLNTNNC